VFQIPRGTRDFTPEDMYTHRTVLENIRKTFQIFGYEEIQTPTFETLELFTAKSGDNVIEELYTFTDKGGRNLALRPELTAPVMRFYVDQLQMRPKPLKLFYTGNCFRYDRPQKGRYREFWQAGCELIGPDTPEAYAELIALAYTIFQNLGLANITINIGNLTIINTLLDNLEISASQKKHLHPLIDKGMFEDLTQALKDFTISNEKIEKFISLLKTTNSTTLQKDILDKEIQQPLIQTTQILDMLQNNFNIKNTQLKLSIVRGLDYYQGIVFEIEAPFLGAEKQLCGGGAYELIPLFGGNKTATAGFAIGVDRTILAMETEEIKTPKLPPQAYIIPVNETVISKGLSIAQLLRDKGIQTDIDLFRRGVSKSLKYANVKQYQFIIIIGPKELEKNAVTLRNMETGKQELVPINAITSKFPIK
jgi:histidyl-tRNA synthetase